MIPKRLFGRTGHNSTVILFGAVAFAAVTQAEADETMELLLEYGINHIDTAAAYGEAEGPARPAAAEIPRPLLSGNEDG